MKCPKIEEFHFRFLLCFKIDHVLISWNVPLFYVRIFWNAPFFPFSKSDRNNEEKDKSDDLILNWSFFWKLNLNLSKFSFIVSVKSEFVDIELHSGWLKLVIRHQVLQNVHDLLEKKMYLIVKLQNQPWELHIEKSRFYSNIFLTVLTT